MSDPTRWRSSRKLTFAGAGYQDLYVPAEAGDVLLVRQLYISADSAVEVVVFFGAAAGSASEPGARDDDSARIFSHEPPANGGASPDLSCLGAWSPAAGRRVRVWCSAAADIHVGAAGTVES